MSRRSSVFKIEMLYREFPFLTPKPGTGKCRKCGKEITGFGDYYISCECGGFSDGYLSNPDTTFAYGDGVPADSIKIKRADSNLFNSTPFVNSYSWCDGGYENFVYAYAIVEGGEIVPFKHSVDHSTGSGDHTERTALPIGEQLREMRLHPDYVVTIKFDDTDANGNGEKFLEVIIYKNKCDAQVEYEKSQLKKAYREIMAEIEMAK